MRFAWHLRVSLDSFCMCKMLTVCEIGDGKDALLLGHGWYWWRVGLCSIFDFADGKGLGVRKECATMMIL